MAKKKYCCNNLHKNKHESDVNESLINLEGFICYCFKHSKLELYNYIKKNQEEELKTNEREPTKNI